MTMTASERPPTENAERIVTEDYLVLTEESTLAPYADSQEHLWDELRRLDQFVRAHTDRWLRMIARTKPEKLWGMVHVSEDEIRAYLTAPYFSPDTLPRDIAALMAPYRQTAQTIRDRIRARRAATAADLELRLDWMRVLFGLSEEEQDIFLLCLLPQLDARYRRLYGFLMDDTSQFSPSIELILSILFPEAPGFGRSLFDASRPLIKYQLLDISSSPVQGDPWQLSRVHADPRLIDFLLDSDRIDARLEGIVSLAEEGQEWDDLFLESSLVAPLARLAHWWSHRRDEGGGSLVFFEGPYGAQQLEAARSFCTASDTRLLVVSVKTGLRSPFVWSQLVTLVYREGGLQNAAIYWEGSEMLLAQDTLHYEWERLIQAADDYNGLTFLTTQTGWEPRGLLFAQSFFSIKFLVPEYSLRRKIWQTMLQKSEHELSEEQEALTVERLANNFLFTPGQVLDALNSATALAALRNPYHPVLIEDDIFEGCRRQSSSKLVSFASRIEPRPGLTFDRVILPAQNKRQLYELRDRIDLKSRVYTELGFGQRLFLGKGLIALFAGSSGTGKTLAASVLAGDLKLDLYKVDLSSVISKYVGETEKNLKQIFADASGSNAILFFDEADALFGKRAEVEKAQDRWANAEINSLLSQLEEYNGVVILASNLSQNIDEAFTRRFQVVVEFPFPNSQDRLQILEGLFPDEVERPRSEDLRVIADRFKLSGGNLKNIVLHAAFLARADQKDRSVITLRHLIAATAREYQKMGLPLKKSEFTEDYYAWVVEDILSEALDDSSQGLA